MRKLFPKLNISRQLLSRGISLVVVFATLVTAYAALSLNITLGWFAESTSAHANGMSAQVYDSIFEVTFTPVTVVTDGKQLGVGEADKTLTADSETGFSSFSDLIANVKVPGQSVTFDVTIKNIGQYSAVLTGFGLEAPEADDDKPVQAEVEGVVQDCYLSTELTTKVLGVSASNENTTLTLNGVAALRLRDEENPAVRIDYFTWLDEDQISLESGDSVTFTIEIHFVDDPDQVQNQYKNYVESGGACNRNLFITHQ